MIGPNTEMHSIKGVEANFYHSLQGIEEDWIAATGDSNIFFKPEFLLALEQAPPIGVRLGYLIFTKNKKAIGAAVLQVQYFKANKNIKYDDSANVGFFGTMARFFRNLVASRVEFHTLVCGSILLTGEHGFTFQKGSLAIDDQLKVLDEGLSFAAQQYESEGIPIAGNLLKDYFYTNTPVSAHLTENGYHEFQVQPNMIMRNVDRWENFDQYLGTLTSKYRVRYRRARKKADKLVRRELSLEEIKAHQDLMYRLYNEVAQNSGFNLVNLNKDYLFALKENLENHFQIFGYFHEDRLVGYFSTIANGHELEAHFLGFEKQVNVSSQLYLNMLYDILEEGIKGEFKEIVFARTAMEIKSSVGAEGFDMNCYLKHQNSFTNKLLPSILSVLKPEKDWVPRSPFKS